MTEGLHKGNPYWIETYTGKRVAVQQLTEEDTDIRDIAHSLSLQCRFIGHCREMYTVAEHCLWVCRIVRTMMDDLETEHYRKTCLAALLHDAAEIYIGDIARPIKYAFPDIREVEQVALGLILKKYGATPADWTLIKKADNIMLATEAKLLMKDKGEGWYLPEPALNIDIGELYQPEWKTFKDIEQAYLTEFKKYYRLSLQKD